MSRRIDEHNPGYPFSRLGSALADASVEAEEWPSFVTGPKNLAHGVCKLQVIVARHVTYFLTPRPRLLEGAIRPANHKDPCDCSNLAGTNLLRRGINYLPRPEVADCREQCWAWLPLVERMSG